jgi:membrane protein DedA with SNARE-associated domain
VSEGLQDLLHLFEHDHSWLAQFFSLLVLPFANEDLAIILGAYIVVNKIMPAALVALCIYGGMVASDFLLYGIGAGARRLPWLTRLAVNDRVHDFAGVLKRNVFGIMALCRLVPGVVFIAFVACGWTRVPLAQFSLASLVISALYLPLMLCIMVFFGAALDDQAGLWAWPFLLCVLVGIGFVRRQVFFFQEPIERSDDEPVPLAASDGGAPFQPALTERVQRALLGLTMMLSWVGFALRYRSPTLPTAVNPRKPMGGIWGESKSEYLLDVTGNERLWIAEFAVMKRGVGPRSLHADLEHAREAMCSAELSFPVVAKSDTGCHDVRRIDDLAALLEYIRHFPAGEKLILQRLVPGAGEAIALYARMPGAQSGRLLSLDYRFDTGQTTDERQRYHDGSRYMTRALEARLDGIARSMREFHYGRFRLRFVSRDGLMQGRELSVIEIDGIGSSGNGVRNTSLSMGEMHRRSIDRLRIMFLIGAKNRERGFEPLACAAAFKSLIGQGQRSRRYRAAVSPLRLHWRV